MSSKPAKPVAPAGQLCAFRAYFRPGRRGYITVRVFDSPRSMRAYAKTHRPFTLRGNFVGLASTWTRRKYPLMGRSRTLPDHGEILLNRHHLGVEPVTHECAHMVLGYARRRRLNLRDPGAGSVASPDEEVFCYALGGLTSAVVAGLIKHSLIHRLDRLKDSHA
jgi:hypothetical protein